MGVSKSDMATTIVLLTPDGYPTSTTQVPILATVKKELGIQEVTLLSDDSDDDVPPAFDIVSLTPPPLQDQPFINPLRIPHSPTVSQPSMSQPSLAPLN
jgi:hypothetical protein